MLLLRPYIDRRKCFFSFIKVFAVFVVASAITDTLICILTLDHKVILCVISDLMIAMVLTLINLKRILLFLILVYQRHAPDHIRMSCRFTPTCSHYMYLSIVRHGVVRGVNKGVRRLIRCKPPNGGIDIP